MQSLITKGAVTALLIAGLVFFGSTVQAQSTSTDQTTIEALQEQVQQLQERVEELRAQLEDRISDDDESDSATSTDDDLRSRMQMRIDRQLSQGDRGPDVERLQELLSSNSEIYPEGLVTGYFGPLTSSAVARLQGRMGLPSVGNVGPQTLSRVNQLLEDGAGNSGIIPPGLLTAPGIQRALSGDTSTSSDDGDDDDEDSETTRRAGPDIENLSIPERIKARLRNAFGDFRFEARDDDDDEDDDDELEIEAEAEDGETEVEVEYPDGTEEEFTFDTMDRSEVIDRLVDETNLTEDEIEAVIDFEIDDDDNEDDEEEDDNDDDEDNDNDDED